MITTKMEQLMVAKGVNSNLVENTLNKSRKAIVKAIDEQMNWLYAEIKAAEDLGCQRDEIEALQSDFVELYGLKYQVNSEITE